MGAGVTNAAAAAGIEGPFWVLTRYSVAAVTTKVAQGIDHPLVAGSRIDIRFDNGRVMGSSGCNSYSGSYVLDGAALAIGPLVSTRKACPPDLMKQEADYQRVLAAADTAVFDGSALKLSGAAGTLEFTSESQPTLTGAWTMTSYNNGKQAVVSARIGTKVTANFGADGRVSGSAGCNDYSGSYQANGAEISIGQVMATQKMCIDPDIMSQEQLFLRAIQAGTTIELRGDTLGLRDAKGATQVTFRRQAAPSLQR